MESWQSKQLIYTTKKTTQQQIRGQSLPRSVSFRNQDNLYQQEEEQNQKQVQERDQRKDKSKNAMEDLIGDDRQQTTSNRQTPVVFKQQNLMEQAKADDYYYKSQQQQHQEGSQYYDSNNNNKNDKDNDNKSNNNGFNSSKVRLLITPAAVVLPKVCGSKQQQMAHSGQQNTASLQANYNNSNNNNNNYRSQQSRQKNYHHYDYYTDSELTSSQEQQNPNEQQLNHYDDENILLFATEHDNNKPKNVRKSSTTSGGGGGNQQRGVTKTTPEKQQQQQREVPFSQKNSSTRTNSTNHQYSSLYTNNAPQQTGKFVNYYPSWRQTQSPTSHYQNYSFHVPLMLQNQHLHPPQREQLYQPRYSFVAPVERIYVTPGGRFKQSFKSQTISHIPTMMKVSVDETTTTKANKTTTPIMSSSNNTYNNIGGASSFEDFYDKPSFNFNTSTNNNKYLMKSDGDLLKAHVVDLRHDQGFDNPFKPGTELSWEAEMMVRLMKRGYPIQELPVLVETAKHLAKDRQKINNHNSLSKINNSRSAKEYIDNEKILNQTNNVSLGKKPTNNKVVINQAAATAAANSSIKRNQKSENFVKLKRQSSENSLNLSSGKQVWANSLSRTKSMPRFSSAINQTSSNIAQYDDDDDTDSIDKLITSIENEMADLIGGGAGSEEDGDDNKRLISELSNNQNKVANKIKVPKGQNKSERRIKNGGHSSVVDSTNDIKVNNNNNKLRLKEVNKSSNSKNYKNSATPRNNNNNPDLINETNTKIKSGKNRCCIIQ